MSIDTEVRPCPSCQSGVFEDESYCEACGHHLVDEAPEEATPAARPPADREERDLGVIAGVTDRGRHRQRNEDAMAIAAAQGRIVAAVCDGVATTANGDKAARGAADTAFSVVQSLLSAPDWPVDSELEGLLAEAYEAAQRAVIDISGDQPEGESPSTTMVLAVAEPGQVAIANIGDSRAYFLSDDASPSMLLTTDDSYAQELIADGTDPEVAYAHQDGHAITRWIGGDAESVQPAVVALTVTQPGILVICSDGLWNYFDDPEALREVIADGWGENPIELARRFTDAALAAGGRDNITVVVTPIELLGRGIEMSTAGDWDARRSKGP